MRRWVTAAALALCLGGCASNLPEPAETVISAPMPLPTKGRVLIQLAQSDLDRKFSYVLNPISRQDTDIKEGEALERAARGLLGRAFAAVAINQPSPPPDVIARVTGTTVYDRVGGTFRVTCGIDAVRADGIPIGHFYNSFKSAPLLSIEASLPRVYARCLKTPLENLLAAPDFAHIAAAGFPPPDRAAADAYLRSQGFIVR